MLDLASPLDGFGSPFGARRGFSPLSLFRYGEIGSWYDPSDLSTMFQDAAGTTPVTATGQPVGLIRDKSGRGNHASQSTDARRPTLQQDSGGSYYLDFDGSDDGLVTASFAAGADKVQVFAGVQKRSDATTGMIAEFSANSNSNAGSWQLRGPGAGTFPGYYFNSSGSTLAAATAQVITGLPANNDAVLTAVGDISGKTSTLYVNGTQVATSAADQGSGNYGTYVLYMGRRGGSSLPANIRLYGLIIRFGANLSAVDLALCTMWMAAKTPLGAFAATKAFTTDFGTYPNGAIPAVSNNGRLFRVAGAINTSTVVPSVSGGACIAADSGQAQTASYFGYDAGDLVREMYAEVSFGAQATGGGFGLICNPDDVGGANTVQAITDNSVHIVFTDTKVDVSYYSGGNRFDGGGTTGTATTVSINYPVACTRDGTTKYVMGWRVVSADTVRILLPNGTTSDVVSANLVAQLGRYAIFEHYWLTGGTRVSFYRLAANATPSWVTV